MTDPNLSFQTSFGRFYGHPKFALEDVARRALNHGMPVMLEADSRDPFSPKPSVTNIIGMLDKKFLPPYFAKLVAEYAIENLESLAAQVKRFGPQVAVGMLKAVPNAPNPAAAVGDEVHAAIDRFVKDEEGEEFPAFSTSTALNMYLQWLHFVSVAKPEIIRSEFTCWSYKHGFAGTGDLLWRLWGGLWLVDAKTGSQVHPEVGMQTVALSKCDVILDAQGNEHPMPKADVLGVMHVRPRSVKLHKLERSEESFKAFLGLKDAFDWRRNDADFVIQAPYRTERPKDVK